MRYISIIIALLITSPTTSGAQETAEDRLDGLIEMRQQAGDLKTLKQAWDAYKSKEYETSLGIWMPLAESGNPSAQVFMGLIYQYGHAVELNRNEAAKWFAMASDQDYAPAKWRLAMLYYHGAGVTQDYQKAADLYRSAAKQGDVYSQKALGVMYSKGFGVLKANVLAYSWFQIATENGFKLAKKYQTELAEKMTSEETTIAKAVAKECKHSGYTKCDWVFGATNEITEDNS